MYITQRQQGESGRSYALRTIKENIVRLELAPGSKVSESEIAAGLGLSRTPVREALQELSRERIVEIYPQRGSIIALVDYTLVDEARFMRPLHRAGPRKGWFCLRPHGPESLPPAASWKFPP